jgi:hypothetical protein
MGQATAGHLEVTGTNVLPIHSHAQAGIADALGAANGLSNGRLLSGSGPQFVHVEEQRSCRLRHPRRRAPATQLKVPQRTPGGHDAGMQPPLEAGAFWPRFCTRRPHQVPTFCCT